MDVLENTLWNRQLGVMSEEIVAALVCQIFEGALSSRASNWHSPVQATAALAGGLDWGPQQKHASPPRLPHSVVFVFHEPLPASAATSGQA